MPDFKPGDPVRYAVPRSYALQKPRLGEKRAPYEISVITTVTPTGIIKTAAGHSFDATGLFRGLSAHEKNFNPGSYRLQPWGPAEQAADRQRRLVALLERTSWKDLPLETLEAAKALLYPTDRTLP